MVHDKAAVGFGGRASTYQQARPSYHPELVARFVRRYGHGPVIEIGAGTGIFTEQLLGNGVDVSAYEPVEQMRSELAHRLPQAFAAPGTAEDLPVEDDAADTVVVAQAFHWFDHRPALDEIHRVLRPGGHLVTVWNVKEGDAPWLPTYQAIIDRYAGGTPRYADMDWRRAIDADPRYQPVDDWMIEHPRQTSQEGVINRALSTSFIAALPQREQDEVVAEIRELLAPFGERFDFPYRAELQAWQIAAA